MNHELPPKHNYVNLTRRDALLRTLAGGLAAAALPLGSGTAAAATPPAPAPQPAEKEEEFTPENDYPFFGATPPWVN